MKYKKESSEVLYSIDRYKKIKSEDLNNLNNLSKKNTNKNIRICTHSNKKSGLHEMFILHPKNYYIRPHKHPSKNESIILLKGKANLYIFNHSGKINKKMILDKNNFYYQIPHNTYHSLVILSSSIVFYEVSLGPFNKKNTVFPKWAPKTDKREIKKFNQFLSSFSITKL